MKVSSIDTRKHPYECDVDGCGEVACFRVVSDQAGARSFCLEHASEVVRSDPAWRAIAEVGS